MHRATHLIAVLALGAAGAAFAQGNPPTTASPNPATGAGQQTQQGTPMGSTGTLTQNNSAGTASSGSSSSTTAQGSGSMSSGTGGSTSNSTTMAAADPMRPARADRN